MIPFRRCLIVLALIFGGIVWLGDQQDPEKLLQWTDNTGKFSVQARFQSADETSVKLEKSDGTVITVPLSRLSPESLAQVKSRMAGGSSPPRTGADSQGDERGQQSAGAGNAEDDESLFTWKGTSADSASQLDLATLKKDEQRLLFARKIAEAYRQLLQQPKLDGYSKSQAEARLKELAPHEAVDAVWVKSKFLTRAEIIAQDQIAERLIAESYEFARKGDEKKWLQKLNDAANANLASPHADFLIGLGQALSLRNYDSAVRSFKESAERAEIFAPLWNVAGSHLQNSALNNMAIAMFRNNQSNLACRFWRQIDGAQDPQQDVYRRNVLHAAVFLAAAERKSIGYVTLPNKNGIKCYGEVFTHFKISKSDIGGHRESGWLFTDYAAHREGIVPLDKEVFKLRDEACLHCQGRSTVKCPGCANGVVGRSRIEIIDLPGGRQTSREVKWTETCPTCNGRAVVDCDVCHRGEEILPRGN